MTTNKETNNQKLEDLKEILGAMVNTLTAISDKTLALEHKINSLESFINLNMSTRRANYVG